MRRLRILLGAGALLLVVGVAGCQPAGRYEARPTTAASEDKGKPSPEAKPAALAPDIEWIDPGPYPPTNQTPIQFVHADRKPDEWRALRKFWTPALLTTPDQAASSVALPLYAVAGLAANLGRPVVKIKVPLGLDDPKDYVPASNPMTVAKWELGRRLFFDDGWLEDKPGVACATCHVPDQGYADREQAHRNGYNTPTLVNSVFNRHQFWDGRATFLEEVVQRTLDDERKPAAPARPRHVWHGVIGRLRNNEIYSYKFRLVFGTKPTQDAVGRAIATYLRTLLAGDSLHDRAARVQADKGSATLEPAHYQAVLDREPALLQELGRAKKKAADVAAELHRGYQLFHNVGARGANCYLCHKGRTFTDDEFHNLGVGRTDVSRGEETGRFIRVPIGRKDRYLIAAYKTPTLRGLLQTRPYLHTGEMDDLAAVVQFHTRGGKANEHLDPLLKEKRDPRKPLDLGLNDEEVEALVLFLRALNGHEVDAAVRSRPPR